MEKKRDPLKRVDKARRAEILEALAKCGIAVVLPPERRSRVWIGYQASYAGCVIDVAVIRWRNVYEVYLAQDNNNFYKKDIVDGASAVFTAGEQLQIKAALVKSLYKKIDIGPMYTPDTWGNILKNRTKRSSK